MGKMQLDAAGQFAADLARIYELMPLIAVALMRGGGADELLEEWFWVRRNLGTHLYAEIINGPCQELMHSIQENLSAKNLPVDWMR